MGLKCWTKGEHQISKLQLQLECVCVLHSVWNSISLMEAEHANCHHSLLTLPSANLAATSKVAHSCMHHILSLQQYCIEGIFQHIETVQYVATVQTLLQYVATPTSLQYCSVAKLQQCKNFNHLVHAPSGLSGREQALWAKQMHVMADWGVMRPICCATSVPSPSHLIKICMPDRNGYLAKSRCCLIILSAVPYQGSEFLFKFQSNLFQLTCFGTLLAQQSLVVSITSWTSF